MIKEGGIALCLMGPTATGKTQWAIELGQSYPIEVISVDSAMVYRGLDIGSGKPTQSECRGVPHHLIDIREPYEPYSVADFCKEASALIRAIQGRGRIPVLVGGTILYFKALMEGLSPLPSADLKIRQRLQREAEALGGWTALHTRLAEVDPLSAARILETDPQRISRALEVFEQTGQPMSLHFSEIPPISEVNWISCIVTAEDRQTLHERIASRFEGMLEKGLIEEVEALKAEPRNHAELPAIRAVGYRQIWRYLCQEVDRGTMAAQAIAATRQLAKRQMTWLRRWPLEGLRWDWQTPELYPAVVRCLEQAIKGQ